MREVAHVPLAVLVPLKDTFHFTAARVFLETKQCQKHAVDLLNECYPNGTMETKNVKVYTTIFGIIKSVHTCTHCGGKRHS